MHMKIPDPYAAWMRRLLIVEVVCFLMLFSLGCAGKTAEDAQEAFIRKIGRASCRERV